MVIESTISPSQSSHGGHLYYIYQVPRENYHNSGLVVTRYLHSDFGKKTSKTGAKILNYFFLFTAPKQAGKIHSGLAVIFPEKPMK
jgi:hypothetical protein